MPDVPIQEINADKKYCPDCYEEFFDGSATCPDDGTELRLFSKDPLVGKVFAERYDIQTMLGVGGMSVVYRARHRLMDRTVAIKMLKRNLKDDNTAMERFRQEAQAASSLNHQNVITVYDFGVTPEGEAFLVMDYLSGESLRDLIDRKGHVPFKRALSIFEQVAAGLDATHKGGIVHRDLKPGNIFLLKQEDGTELAKLVDFGIAKMLPVSGKKQMQLTQTGQVFGSPIYMSPEQCLGRELDARSDIYAFGCLMYETLTGEPPFMGDSILDIMNKHVGEEPKPFEKVIPEAAIPPELEQIMRRCMQKDPQDRFQSVSELCDALTGLMLQLFGQSGRPKFIISTATASTSIKIKTNKPPLAMIMGVVIAVALIGVITFCLIYPGPEYDRGTIFDKIIWQIATSNADSAITRGEFSAADQNLQLAESKARTFSDDKVRLESTLKLKSRLYDKWEGHAEELESTNRDIMSIQAQRIKNELEKQLALLATFDQPTDSLVRKTNAKLRAEAQLPYIINTAAKLYGHGMYQSEEEFLDKARAIEDKLLGGDSLAAAQLDAKLAECLIALRNYPRVRVLLQHVCDLRKKHSADNPEAYVAALGKLGQYDLDQNNFKDAEPELTEALRLARALKQKNELLVLCLRSYADLLRQTHRTEEASNLLKEANNLGRELRPVL